MGRPSNRLRQMRSHARTMTAKRIAPSVALIEDCSELSDEDEGKDGDDEEKDGQDGEGEEEHGKSGNDAEGNEDHDSHTGSSDHFCTFFSSFLLFFFSSFLLFVRLEFTQ